MQITTVRIHNFRSLLDVEFHLNDYSLLVGANNAGKSNVIDALRVFYDDPKFDVKTDEPKVKIDQKESWIEIDFLLSDDEYDTLKESYKIGENVLRVRKNLTGNKKGIFAYEVSGNLSEDPFYGARNVQQGKFGDLIHIPAVSTLEDQLKTSGPSALRNMINGIVSKLVKSSAAFQVFLDSFSETMDTFQEETTEDDFSLMGLQNDVNAGISEWDAKFRININPFSETEIVKNLVSFDFVDFQVNDAMPAKNYGQGFQRYVIYTLLTLASKYSLQKSTTKKIDFKPNLTLILFEEPEAFLHPPHQDTLRLGMQRLCRQEGTQVIASTHSPHFVSHNTRDLRSIVRLHRKAGQTHLWQLSENDLKRIFHDNQKVNDVLGVSDDDENRNLDMEAIKYFLWLNPARCGMFFAEQVLLVEGMTEVVFVNYLLTQGHIELPKGGLFVLDCFGKYNMHRFMGLMGKLGIRHSILYDSDDGEKHRQLADLISSNNNSFTAKTGILNPDLEDALGIPKAARRDQKPQHLMFQLEHNTIERTKLNEVVAIISDLIDLDDSTTH